MRVSLGTRQGQDMLELQLVYGVQGDAVRNAAFMAKVLEGNAAVGYAGRDFLSVYFFSTPTLRDLPGGKAPTASVGEALFRDCSVLFCRMTGAARVPAGSPRWPKQHASCKMREVRNLVPAGTRIPSALPASRASRPGTGFQLLSGLPWKSNLADVGPCSSRSCTSCGWAGRVARSTGSACASYA